jgi:hypothetical protein
MRYMLFCCIDERRWDAMPDAHRDAVMRDYDAWVGDMKRLGTHVESARLAPPSSARTLRRAGGARQVVDGPFAETKEQLGGYHVLECRDLEEALAHAERIPTLPHGGVVEVRALEGPA